VWLAEALNTAIERLADAVTLEPNENIGYAKDVAAGAVLAAAIISVVIGLTIFAPHLLRLFRRGI
jgi:diacylglycerol kinase